MRERQKEGACVFITHVNPVGQNDTAYRGSRASPADTITERNRESLQTIALSIRESLQTMQITMQITVHQSLAHRRIHPRPPVMDNS